MDYVFLTEVYLNQGPKNFDFLTHHLQPCATNGRGGLSAVPSLVRQHGGMRRLSHSLRGLPSLGRTGLISRPPEASTAVPEAPPPRPYRPPASAGISRCRSDVLGSSILQLHNRKPLLTGISDVRTALSRRFSSINERDDISLEEDAERKVGWLLKLIFMGTASVVAYQFFPYMGDNLLQQSISLLHVKDPLFKRMGASRLARFAVDEERIMKVVEMGGAQELLNMLEAAKDDKTRKQALKALVALSHSDQAAEALHQAGAITTVSAIPNSSEYAEVEMYKSNLLRRFQELQHAAIALEGKGN
ncbi:uncharacterized protein LOC103712127 isoform X1 [Phoenix dactylifera]|uniref:Uncharacterized protein LOC103712127 isoform X1 n=1 Tax=Phoenix dactylifera TaxID=42345 RepID=A0A8B7CDM2_PHODC|nr:uncharacterized protein LOC103712127 isoform X1 [Phoenix dactylifera]